VGFDAIAQRQYVFPVLVSGVRAVREVLRAFHDHVHSAQQRFLFAQDERQPAANNRRAIGSASGSCRVAAGRDLQ